MKRAEPILQLIALAGGAITLGTAYYLLVLAHPAWSSVPFEAFLAVNAFVFLVPMMPELLALAEASVSEGVLGAGFHDLEATEALIGMSNVIPLLTEMVMGAYRPRITKAERAEARTSPA